MRQITMPKHNAAPEVMKSVLKVFFENKNKWLDNSWIINELKLQSNIDENFEQQSYTKMTQIPSYFRFIEWEFPNNRRSRKRMTESGSRFFHALINNNKSRMHEEILFSLENIHFGRNVHGTPSCNSNVEPPKLFIFFALDLGYLTYKEFAYVLENINEEVDNLDELKGNILLHRKNNFELISNLKSKYVDAKPIKALLDWEFFKNQNIGFPYKIGINDQVLTNHSQRIKQIASIYNSSLFQNEVSNYIVEISETESQAFEREKASILGDKAEKFFKDNVIKEFGFKVTDKTNKIGLGYDFFCEKKEFYIEVKGCRGEISSIRLTENEWRVAEEKKSKYKLVIVYDIDDTGNEKMKMIDNPFKYFNKTIKTNLSVVKTLHISGKEIKDHKSV